MKVIMLLLISITAMGQTYRPDLSKRVAEEINRSRANIGIWRADVNPRKQSESDTFVMAMYNRYKGEPIAESDDYYSDFNKMTFKSGITSTVVLTKSENYFENNLRRTVQDEKDFFNPLAFRMSVSVLEDNESGYIYWVVIMYR